MKESLLSQDGHLGRGRSSAQHAGVTIFMGSGLVFAGTVVAAAIFARRSTVQQMPEKAPISAEAAIAL